MNASFKMLASPFLLRLVSARCAALDQELHAAQMEIAKLRVELAGTRHDQRRAHHRALHDSLTALPNRSFLLERLRAALAAGTLPPPPLALLYLDLDGFKAVNDEHGHAVGDRLLTVVAERLVHAVRADDMVSRLGGDEFACLVAHRIDHAHLTLVARKMYDTVSAPVKLGRLVLSVCPSIGIATVPADGTTAEGLLQSADRAMYRAKRERCGHAFAREPALCTAARPAALPVESPALRMAG